LGNVGNKGKVEEREMADSSHFFVEIGCSKSFDGIGLAGF
jgi:hypothetical protein